MLVDGKRVHFAGSADADAPPEILGYAHDLVGALVTTLANHGAGFVFGVSGEPHQESSGHPLHFDWTAWKAVHDALDRGDAKLETEVGAIVATMVTGKTDRQVPEGRRELWKSLLARGAVELHYVEPGWSSGAVRRIEMAEMGDILIAISGGEGVEHLAQLYLMQGKPVIPLDLQLGGSTRDGSGGAGRLFERMRAHPAEYVELVDPASAGRLIAAIGTNQGAVPIHQVVTAISQLLDAVKPPTVFYVRLVNSENSAYRDVEEYFRQVVDPVMVGAGFEPQEVGRNPGRHPWINDDIFEGLHYASLVVVDLTAERPNCFVELGYALGRARRVLLSAVKGTNRGFDVGPADCYLWDPSSPIDQRRQELKSYWLRNKGRSPLVRARKVL